MPKNLYVWSLIAAVLLLSVQVVGLAAYVYSFVPLSWDDSFIKGLEPNRDPLFFAVFLVTAAVLMILGAKWFLPQLNSVDIRRKFKLWLAMESVWCFLMVFCFFKWTTYRYPFWNVLPYENPTWLQPFFCATCAMAVLVKIFFPETEILFRRLQVLGAKEASPRWHAIIVQVIFIAGVMVLLYVPHPQDVAALALVWDQWNHLDQVAGWFIKHGWGISYEQTIQILVMAAMVYIIGLFYFIRLWLNSWLLAATGALLAVKMGMFYDGSVPCIWINPANTFLVHGWDIVLFFGLWLVLNKYPSQFYTAAAVMGIVLVAGWFKSNGYIDALGLDNQPMMAPLRVRQFFPYFMGYVVPLFYVFSLLIFMGQKTVSRDHQARLPVVICIYGLMIYVDYLEHPVIGYYGALMVPAILIILWWLKQLLCSSTLLVRRGACAGILLLVLGALLTNRLMLTYPNIIYQDKDRFSRERGAYEHFDTITQSAALIRQLTREDQKVALLSNFEVALLMQANRRPLFKDFPVMFSNSANGPAGLNLKTKKQCVGLMDSLAMENPPYVFVDQRLLALSPQILGNSGLYAVLSFLHDHYAIYARQGLLAVLQRR